MSTKVLGYALGVSILLLVCVDTRVTCFAQSAKVAVLVEGIERVGQNEARFRVKVTNTSGIPIFSTGTDFDSTHRGLDIYLDQKRGKEGWELVVPCKDTASPHIIKVQPAMPMLEERTLTLPLSSVCKKRDLQLVGQFRFRVDYFESRAQARLYLKRFLENRGNYPRPQVAFSEPFEIPAFSEAPR